MQDYSKILAGHAADVCGVATVHRVLTTERKNIKRTVLSCYRLLIPILSQSHIDLVPDQRPHAKRKREQCDNRTPNSRLGLHLAEVHDTEPLVTGKLVGSQRASCSKILDSCIC